MQVDLEPRITMPNFPASFAPPGHPPSEDVNIDATWGSCSRCGSLQLMTLVDQDILYACPHNDTSTSKVWKEHNAQFAQFISPYIGPESTIIDIGGATGNLGRLLRDHVKSYIVMDIAPYTSDEFVFIQENCEKYKFRPSDTIIMSHVFEHLYSPLDFIENCKNNNVENIFLSHPVMFTNTDIPPIDTEHTYFADDLDVKKMFATHGYDCNSNGNLPNHSYFLHFKLAESCEIIDNLRPRRADMILDKFIKRANILEKVKLEGNIFVAPAGPFGQMVSYYTKYNNIIGFLDNDVNKQGKRVYGTPFTTYPFTVLEGLDSPKVLIYARHHAEELEKQIKSINQSAEIFGL